MPNPYKTHEKASEGVGIAGAAAGASGGFPNPMGGVQNAQKAYHMHQYGNIVRLRRGDMLRPRDKVLAVC